MAVAMPGDRLQWRSATTMANDEPENAGRGCMHKDESGSTIEIDESLLRQILDALPVGIWIAGADGRLVACNPAGQAIWAGGRWIGVERFGEYKACWSGTGKRLTARDWGLARAIAHGEISHNEMLDIECFDGSRKTILNSAMPIRGEDGTIRAAIAVNQDISEFKRTHDALDGVRRQLEALSGAVLSIQERERKHLSMELHDEIGQVLSALKIAVETARRRCQDADVAELLGQASAMADTLVSDVREIARRLRPPPLDDLGLVAAVRWHLDRIGKRMPIRIRFSADPEFGRLDESLELGCFRIVQESVSNAIRHAHADHLDVRLELVDAQLHLRVCDDGVGFQPEALYDPETETHPLGLLGMRERASQLGGELRVRSAPGSGTEISARFPLEQAS